MGSSSSFSVALVKAINAYQVSKIDKRSLAEAASYLEIDVLKEPIGKQDQYAAAFGGFNVFQFNSDGSVEVAPVLMDFRARLALEDRMLLFYSGITRDASSVLTEQKSNIAKKFETLKAMADAVPEFEARLMQSDFAGLGKMFTTARLQKKSLSTNGSGPALEAMYDAGITLERGAGNCLALAAVDACSSSHRRKRKRQSAQRSRRRHSLPSSPTSAISVAFRPIRCGGLT